MLNLKSFIHTKCIIYALNEHTKDSNRFKMEFFCFKKEIMGAVPTALVLYIDRTSASNFGNAAYLADFN